MNDRRQQNLPVDHERRAVEPERQRWKLGKEISIADILSIILAAAAGFGAWTNLNTRLAVVEDHQSQQAATDKRQDDDSLRYQARLEAVVGEINHKLDRLIERR